MIQLSLYTTMGCHLCSQLEALVAALANQKVWLHHIEISDDDALVERYGLRIPVLVDGDGNELDRGFELERLSAWLRERGWLDEAALAGLTALPDTTPPKGAHKRDGRRFLG
ncbi:glutaredoxin family protein [Vreelandella titanicae]|uniref:glutaredoxin family protein n=1 Tax=Vreelandella titanicae TaxID=664683 RepID=UPI00241DDD33|nr:glutaredoxin family protein [Halomonas titanicae]UEQ05554.1 glutaredoxin family protein [Halomonas profundus]